MPLPWQRGTPGGDELERARERMVRDQIQRRGLADPELLRAFRTVPRHLFVDGDEAYEDRALPLTQGQTISQPYVVASMTDAARPPGGWRGARALEIGTGSGYQAAILAELGAQVISVERHADLSGRAAAHLTAAGYGPDRVQLVVGDGTRGWPASAPYDSIVVTAAGPRVPQPLIDQLRPDGGRLIMPIGPREHQWLTVIERRDGETITRESEPVVFVPLLGDFGFEEER